MDGIQFLTDDKGRRTAAVIDLKKHGTVLEEFWDGLIVESRAKKKTYRLKKSGRLARNVN